MTRDAAMQACIDTCQSCHATCLSEAMTHCLTAGGAHLEPAHFRLMIDCAAMCAASADFMLRESAYHGAACGLCAAICEACAVSCEAVGDMETCVAACRKCAESCRQMAAA